MPVPENHTRTDLNFQRQECLQLRFGKGAHISLAIVGVSYGLLTDLTDAFLYLRLA